MSVVDARRNMREAPSGRKTTVDTRPRTPLSRQNVMGLRWDSLQGVYFSVAAYCLSNLLPFRWRLVDSRPESYRSYLISGSAV